MSLGGFSDLGLADASQFLFLSSKATQSCLDCCVNLQTSLQSLITQSQMSVEQLSDILSLFESHP